MITLPASLVARDAARAKHQEAAAALERAQHAQSTAAGEVERLAAEERSWLNRYASKLSEWISAGSKGPRPEPKADAAVLVKQASARAQLTAADAALESFSRAEREASQQFANTETSVRQAALAILAAEGEALAQRILARDAETEAMRQQLLGLRGLVRPSEVVRRAAWLPTDWIETPLPELRALEAAGGRHTPRLHTPLDRLDRHEVDPAAIEHWRKRLESLLSGEGAPPSSSPVERAA